MRRTIIGCAMLFVAGCASHTQGVASGPYFVDSIGHIEPAASGRDAVIRLDSAPSEAFAVEPGAKWKAMQKIDDERGHHVQFRITALATGKRTLQIEKAIVDESPPAMKSL